MNGSLLSIRISKFTDSSAATSTDLDDIPKKTKWDESSFVCTNALKRLTYLVVYNNTAIEEISVEIEAADVAGSTRGLEQEFAVKFAPIEVEPSQRSHGKNNLVGRTRSGSPGYIAGKPTLGAISNDDNHTQSHVIAQKAGFTIMDTGIAGKCETSSPTGSVREVSA